MPSLFATLIILLYSYLHQIKCGVWLSVYNCLIILENLSQVSTPFLHDRSDFFASELNLIPRPRVPFDTAIAFSLYAKTIPPVGLALSLLRPLSLPLFPIFGSVFACLHC